MTESNRDPFPTGFPLHFSYIFNPLLDLHEDRWNRLTISSRKEDLKSFAKSYEVKLDDYITFSKHGEHNDMSFQTTALNGLHKDNNDLKKFSTIKKQNFLHV